MVLFAFQIIPGIPINFDFKNYQTDLSVIVIIDALDFSEKTGREQNQYSKKSIRR